MSQSRSRTEIVNWEEIRKRIECIPGYSGYKGARLKSIKSAYFKMMEDAMFSGFSFTIPYVGSFVIQKSVISGDRKRKSFNLRTKKAIKKHGEKVLSRLGYYYEISFIPNETSHRMTKFKASKRMRQRLNHLLINTDKDFRMS